MAEDINTRLKEKTIRIVSLNQRIEALQAQLEGSQRRAFQMSERIASLENELAEKQSENEMLRQEITNSKAALDSVGREMQGIRAEQTSLLSKKKPTGEDNSLKDELSGAQMEIDRLRNDLRRFSEVATAVVNGDVDARSLLGDVLREVGDSKYRVLILVLSSKSASIDEIASNLVINTSEAIQLVDELEAEGELEMRNGSTVIPGSKYRELEVPKDEWAILDPMDIFTHLEKFVGRTDDQSTIVRALESAVEILEQKLARGGALVFQMRRTADSWRKQPDSIEELQYTIREWAGRAKALS
jgi:chromosome segregation ATPase